MALSLEGAAGWTTPIPVAVTVNHSENPAIALDAQGNPHVVWSEERSDAGRDIYYSRWDGTSWTGPFAVTATTSRSMRPHLAVDSAGLVHIVWEDDRDGQIKIFYSQGNDTSWSSPISLSGAASYPKIGIDSTGTRHVVWDDKVGTWDIFYASSTDGQSWVTEWIPGSGSGYASDMAVDHQDVVHVVWITGLSQIHYARRTAMGWTTPEVIFTGNCDRPSIAVDGNGQVHVSWLGGLSGGDRNDIYYRMGSAGNWPPVVENVSNDQKSEWNDIVVNGDNVPHVVWDTWREGPQEIYHAVKEGGAWVLTAEMLLRDPSDLSLGYLPPSGPTVREIPDSLYSDPTWNMALASITNPRHGIYRLTLTGVGGGTRAAASSELTTTEQEDETPTYEVMVFGVNEAGLRPVTVLTGTIAPGQVVSHTFGLGTWDDAPDAPGEITESSPTNVQIRRYIEPEGDLDWFRFEVGETATIRVHLTSLPADYDLYLYDADGQLLASSTRPGHQAEHITLRDRPPPASTTLWSSAWTAPTTRATPTNCASACTRGGSAMKFKPRCLLYVGVLLLALLGCVWLGRGGRLVAPGRRGRDGCIRQFPAWQRRHTAGRSNLDDGPRGRSLGLRRPGRLCLRPRRREPGHHRHADPFGLGVSP